MTRTRAPAESLRVSSVREGLSPNTLRFLMGWFLNILLPGTGLILRRREWLGLSLAMIFAICGNAAIAGWMIAPRTLPPRLTSSSAALAGFAWVLAQYLHFRQGRILARTRHSLEALLAEARAAMAERDFAAARRALDHGVALDDEDVELHVLRARLLEMEGNRQAGREEWRLVMKLDRRKQYIREARGAVG